RLLDERAEGRTAGALPEPTPGRIAALRAPELNRRGLRLSHKATLRSRADANPHRIQATLRSNRDGAKGRRLSLREGGGLARGRTALSRSRRSFVSGPTETSAPPAAFPRCVEGVVGSPRRIGAHRVVLYAKHHPRATPLHSSPFRWFIAPLDSPLAGDGPGKQKGGRFGRLSALVSGVIPLRLRARRRSGRPAPRAVPSPFRG